MELCHFMQEEADGRMALCQPGYANTVEARKHIKELPQGTYHLVSFNEVGIEVTPPEMPSTNLVTRGTVLRTRAPNKNPKGKGKGKGKANDGATPA